MKMVFDKFSYYKFSELNTYEKNIYYKHIYCFLRHLVIEYPFFKDWYNKLFIQNYELKSEREILICEHNYTIVGIAILKNSAYEKKICTLRVLPEYQKCGIGKTLISKSLEWLNTDKPLITVHKCKNKEFESLFKYFDFKLEQSNWSYYNLFSTELVYNGELPGHNILLNKIELLDIQTLMKENYDNIYIAYEKCLDRWIQREKNLRKLLILKAGYLR